MNNSHKFQNNWKIQKQLFYEWKIILQLQGRSASESAKRAENGHLNLLAEVRESIQADIRVCL